jgi:hypothetical protein
MLSSAAHGAKAYNPPESKQGLQNPVTIALPNAIALHLSPINPVHMVVWAAATAAFFGIARLGKIVQKSKCALVHLPKHKNLQEDVKFGGNIVTIASRGTLGPFGQYIDRRVTVETPFLATARLSVM